MNNNKRRKLEDSHEHIASVLTSEQISMMFGQLSQTFNKIEITLMNFQHRITRLENIIEENILKKNDIPYIS